MLQDDREDGVTVSRTVNDRVITAICAPGQEPLARDLLDAIARIASRAPLTADTHVRFGWSRLTLREEPAGGLVVCEPDFDGNPNADVRPRVDTTLQVLLEQVRLLRRVGATPVDVAFDDDVIVRRGALDRPEIGLYREEPSPGDSGWRVLSNDAASNTDEDFDVLPVHALLRRRPSIVAALALPIGFGVQLVNDRITKVFDASGRDCLAR